MIQTTSLLTATNIDAERRRALAKVYTLLIRLAEEAEKTDETICSTSSEAKVPEPSLTDLAL